MANKQIVNYEAIEQEKNIINDSLTKTIDCVTRIRTKFLKISENENLWVGEKADAFIESVKKFFDNTQDGQSIISRLENEKNDIYNFLDTVILETKKVDENQAENLSVE